MGVCSSVNVGIRVDKTLKRTFDCLNITTNEISYLLEQFQMIDTNHSGQIEIADLAVFFDTGIDWVDFYFCFSDLIAFFFFSLSSLSLSLNKFVVILFLFLPQHTHIWCLEDNTVFAQRRVFSYLSENGMDRLTACLTNLSHWLIVWLYPVLDCALRLRLCRWWWCVWTDGLPRIRSVCMELLHT